MNGILESVLNFAPGYKRYITIAVATAMFVAAQLGVEIPAWAVQLLGLFGFNALAQAPKNQ